MKKVYYCVCIKKSKEWKTAFWMRYKHYKYIVMSFKLKNVLIIFQRLINNILREYLNDFVITYLDDILIYLDNLETHCEHVHKVLTKLNEWAMYVKKLKSRFKIKKIQFLRYVIQSKQIKKNLKKTEAVKNWLMLKKIKKVQVFLELTNYYWKFMFNYVKIVKSLMYLICKDKKWHWDKKQKNVFCALKRSLSETAYLWIFN